MVRTGYLGDAVHGHFSISVQPSLLGPRRPRSRQAVDVLGHVGTQLRAYSDTSRPHDTFETEYHHVISWGHRATKYSNRSAGIAILLRRRRFKKHHVTQVMDPPPELAGRVAAVRIKQGT